MLLPIFLTLIRANVFSYASLFSLLDSPEGLAFLQGDLQAIKVLNPHQRRAFENVSLKAVAADIEWLKQKGHFLLTCVDEGYPDLLRHIPDPPIALFGKGKAEYLHSLKMGVVGSRSASVTGLKTAEAFAESLSREGITVVSGLAMGIDTAAHQGALMGKGSTIAVCGTGLDIIYPKSNGTLAEAIAEEGLLLSEYPPGTAPIARNFPIRNRIISGLSLGILVVEANLKSGSLITARLAAEQGRDVFAIPGSIHSSYARGCHKLIQEGAKLVSVPDDILEELPPLSRTLSSKASKKQALPPLEKIETAPIYSIDCPEIKQILACMNAGEPVNVEMLFLRTGFEVQSLNCHLVTLELQGIIQKTQGNGYIKIG
jgi:DNA processing protein